MADLFDMKVGGAGWHVTSHLIALVALFVACFAITGYISFRDDSVPGAALKEDADEDQHLIVVDVPVKAMVTADPAETLDLTFTQPANTWIQALNTVVTDAFTETNDVLTIGVSTGAAATGTVIVTAADFGTDGTLNALGAHSSPTVIGGSSWTAVERTVHIGIVRATAITSDAGNIKLFFQLVSAV